MLNDDYGRHFRSYRIEKVIESEELFGSGSCQTDGLGRVCLDFTSLCITEYGRQFYLLIVCCVESLFTCVIYPVWPLGR